MLQNARKSFFAGRSVIIERCEGRVSAANLDTAELTDADGQEALITPSNLHCGRWLCAGSVDRYHVFRCRAELPSSICRR